MQADLTNMVHANALISRVETQINFTVALMLIYILQLAT